MRHSGSKVLVLCVLLRLRNGSADSERGLVVQFS